MKRFFLAAILALCTLTMSAANVVWYNGHDPVTYQVQGKVSPVVEQALQMFAEDMELVTTHQAVSDQHAPNWGLHPVKKKAANELGLYDMSGNVREYCQDVFGQYTAEAQTNPKGPKKDDDPGYVIRGGGWDEVAEKCRVTYREGLWATHYSNDSGLRLALTKK